MAALTIIFFACLLPSCLSSNDTDALTQFRSGADVHGALASNWTAGDACAAGWLGVRCFRGRVVALSLPSLGLRGGPLDPLARLDQLRVLDLHNNRLNGTFLAVANCSNLKLLYLAGNDFSGDIPPEIASLRRLLRLDLSDNNLRGPIPAPLTNLTRLLTLLLQDNALSGPIPSFAPDSPLAQLDLSNNQLYGPVPDALLRRFGNRSFAGNQGLCGSGSSPFPVCSGAPPPAEETTVPSNPSSLPTRPTNGNHKQAVSGLSSGAIVAIVIGNAVLLLVLASFAVAYCCGRPSRDSGCYSYDPKGSNGNGDQNKVCDSDAAAAEEPGRLVFYDRKKQFDLEDLLRASAEMLGKGGFGTVYRAVLEDGGMVAVKRLKDANPCPRREFEQYMDMIGRLKHPNIAHLRAYYYAKEEKLLVYEYLPNGNLHSLLHGNRGPGRIPLDWTTRMSLVLGAARGLARIHEEYNVAKIPHGNVKSSNILLDDNGIARVSDFGLALLLNPVHAAARLGGYRAPEQVETKRLSQKADVYSFGVVLLEVLTGKAPSQPHASPVSGISIPGEDEEEEGGLELPRWVRSVVRDEWTAEVFDQELLRYRNIEEELVMMLQVGLACVAPQPEKRPSMLHVVKMIEDIRVEQSLFVDDDLNESRSSHRSGY